MKTVIEMALEALESCDAAHITDGGHQWYDEKLVDTAYAALREALAEQPAQQEPVAYGMWDTMLGKNNRMMMVRLDNGQDGCTVPLYTPPPAQRTWVGLTDEQREAIAKGWRGRNWTVGNIIDAVEAKLKEKNA